MNRFMAWWLRKVVKNEVRPSILYLLFFRKSVNKHFVHSAELWRKNKNDQIN